MSFLAKASSDSIYELVSKLSCSIEERKVSFKISVPLGLSDLLV